MTLPKHLIKSRLPNGIIEPNIEALVGEWCDLWALSESTALNSWCLVKYNADRSRAEARGEISEESGAALIGALDLAGVKDRVLNGYLWS